VIPRLHLLTRDEELARPDFLVRASELLEVGGAQMALHLRAPRSSARHLWRLAVALRPLARASGSALLVNDRADVVMALPGLGLHLAARSLSPSLARGLLPSGVLLGGSFSLVPSEVAEVDERSLLDFLFVGGIYPTASHPGRAGTGIQGLAPWVAEAEGAGTPLLVVGGVTAERIPEILAVGGWGGAVIRAVWGVPDPILGLQALLGAIDSGSLEGADPSEQASTTMRDRE